MTPNFDTHISCVKEHLACYSNAQDDCICAKCILLFYAGMHLIEAVAYHNDGKCFEHHSQRSTYMAENHRKEAKHYQNLYDIGYQARYKPHLLAIQNSASLESQYKAKIFDNCLMIWAARVLKMPELSETIESCKLLYQAD